MNEHDRIRELLALAAAGALEPREDAELAAHVNSCPACSEELRAWQAVQAGLRRIPTPQAPAALVARTIQMAQARHAEGAEQRTERRLIAMGVVFSWFFVALSWPLVQLADRGWMSWIGAGFAPAWERFAFFTGLCWLAGAAAAVVLAWHRQREGRVA